MEFFKFNLDIEFVDCTIMRPSLSLGPCLSAVFIFAQESAVLICIDDGGGKWTGSSKWKSCSHVQDIGSSKCDSQSAPNLGALIKKKNNINSDSAWNVFIDTLHEEIDNFGRHYIILHKLQNVILVQ